MREWMSEEREAHLRATLAAHGAGKVSDEGLRCADLLERWLGGLHHMPGRKRVRGVEWDAPFVRVLIGHSLATYDFARLTHLVFLAHDLAIRAELGACNMQHVELMLHPRRRRADGSWEGWVMHPSLNEAVTAWRERNPLPGAEVSRG